MITAWRIVKKAHAASAFSGKGAFLFGGRWNSQGILMVYLAGSQSLSALEQLVHTGTTVDLVAGDFVIIPVEFPDSLVADVGKLPKNWREYPAPRAVAVIGDRWIQASSSVALRVPSAVIPDESNYLLNPLHRDFSKIKIGKARKFTFDSRLGRLS